MSRYRIAGVNFDHFHMGDNLRAAHEHKDAEIVGLCDEQPQRTALLLDELVVEGPPALLG